MRYFIELSYNGTLYFGWQIQKNRISIEEVIEYCLSKILKAPINIIGSGRTDKGVHAKQFFAHFDYRYFIDKNILKKINSFLPCDIKIHNFYQMISNAHSRFNAITRSYSYFISLDKKPFFKEFSFQLFYTNLNIELMNKASQILKEYKDFKSFCKKPFNKENTFCKIEYAKWEYKNGFYIFNIRSNRFLRNMVRSIVGVLIEIGKEKINYEEIHNIIVYNNKKNIGESVPARGLFLTSITYPNNIFL